MRTKRKNKLLRLAGIIVLMALGGVAGYWGGYMGFKAASTMSGTEVLVTALLMLPLFFVVIGVHEAGHALAGIAMKFDFRMYVVGPFLWDKERTGWRFKWNKNVNTFGGLVICIPSPVENLSKRFAAYAAGGPFASLLLALLLYGAHQALEVFDDSAGWFTVLLSLLFIGSVFSGIIFLLTIIPFHSGGFSSDGARIWRLWRGGDAARFEVLLLNIISDSMAGTRPSQYNMLALEEAQTLADKLDAPMSVYLQHYFYYHALDTGDLKRAEEHLNNYLAQLDAIPEGVRGSVWIEAAFFYAWFKKEDVRATEYHQRYKPSALIPRAIVLAAEASIAALQHDHEKAGLLARHALEEIPNMMDRGAGVFLKEQMLALVEPIVTHKINY
ncbi:MAG: hypothetical protein MUE95_03715 [Cyclobacteriaceae bacterium]|jgi:hypothetical protein|nr:hypothetical protein [Cyclobacteriaceae bacterium]